MKVYDTITEAGRETNTNCSNICLVTNKKRKTAGGYHWQSIKQGAQN